MAGDCLEPRSAALELLNHPSGLAQGREAHHDRDPEEQKCQFKSCALKPKIETRSLRGGGIGLRQGDPDTADSYRSCGY